MADRGANHRRADHRRHGDHVFWPPRHPTPAMWRRDPAQRTLLARRTATLEASHGMCTWAQQSIRCMTRAADVLVLDHRDRALCGRHLAVARRQGAQRLT